MSTKLCDRCKRRIRSEAISCLCGWSASGAVSVREVVPCCFSGCPEGAICRVWTETGWANVCLTHYPKIERSYRRSNAPAVVEARKAYEGSFHYRQKHGISRSVASDRSAIEAELAEVKRRMEAALPAREPGADDEPLALGIARDPLEQEFMDRAEP